jgi:SPP1 family predicted phage head-tail adaptor
MPIGDLDRRVTIEQAALSPDGAGGGVVTWSELATVWGRLQPVAGREHWQAMQLQGAASQRVTIRRRTDVTAAMRARIDNRVFNIRAVLNGGAREPYSELFCEEGVAT